MSEFEIDTTTSIKKRKGWNVISGSDIQALGEQTVAQKIADAEGTSLAEAKDKLKKAKEKFLKAGGLDVNKYS